ncbi:MFS transporter [Granulicoccus sp. GXG6511]|uniref:MFS transporter n=1 Tax=Granulicoccus sp. GXG6511 TaxID=3381351 RepID=UPI003D7CE64D
MSVPTAAPTERPPTPTGQSTVRHWVVVIGTTLVMVAASVVLSGLSLVTAPVVANLYTADDGRTPINGGAAAFLIYFSLMTAAIVVPLMFFSGRLLAKYGARVMLVVGGIVIAAGLAVFAVSTNSAMFYAAGIIMGLGYGASLALIPPALVTAWFVAKKGLVLGIVLAGTGVGGFLWSFILPPLMAQAPDAWRTAVWLMAGALLALVILPALLLIKNKPGDVGLVPYGMAEGAAGPARPDPNAVLPGLTYQQAIRSAAFWIAAAGFFLFGVAVAVTQVLSIVFKSAAYENPIDRATWTPQQISFYSTLFMVWTIALVFWKPILGILNDKIGLIGMMLVTLALMVAALFYMPSMLYGSNTALMFAAMVGMSAGISNATVTPPLVMAAAVGPRDFGRVFALAVALYYAGNAIGAPLWGFLGNLGQYALGMRLAPILVGLFILASVAAVRMGKAQWANKT